MDSQSKKRNNLYHYKINYSTQRNNDSYNLIKNTQISNYGNYKNSLQNNLIELNADSLKGFGKQYFKNENSSNKKNFNNKNIKFKKKNNYINIESYSNEEQNDKNNTYNNNNNFYLNKNINSQKYGFGERSSESAQNSEFIGIDRKYEKKINDLEKNILNAHNHNNLNNNNIKKEQKLIKNNNIENFSNKLKVNIINMEDYALKKKKKNIQKNDLNTEKIEKIGSKNNTEINKEKEEQNLNDGVYNDNEYNNNENEFLSQKQNMICKK